MPETYAESVTTAAPAKQGVDAEVPAKSAIPLPRPRDQVPQSPGAVKST